MRRPAAFLLLALVLGAGPAAAGPDVPAPAASPPRAGAPGPSPASGATPPGDTVVLGRHHLSLAEVLAHARATHPTLRAAAARYQQAEARVRQSLASNAPNVYLEISRTESYTQGTGPDSKMQLSPSMNLAYKLYDGDLRNRTVEQKEQDLLTYEFDWRSKWRDLALVIQQRYLDVVLRKALVEVAEENLRMTDDALRYARGLVRGGRKSRLDVLQAESELSGARATWVERLGQLNSAWASLEASVGAPLNTYATLDDLLGEETSFPAEGQAADRALQNRSDLRSLGNQVEVQRLQVKVNDTALNPTIQGVLKYGAVGADFPLVQTWQTSLDLQIPLNVRNQTESRNLEAVATGAELEQRAEALCLEIRGNLRADYVDWHASAERVRITEKQVEEAREAWLLAERRYRTGIFQFVELTQARTVLNQARASYEQARSDHRLAAFKLANEMEDVP